MGHTGVRSKTNGYLDPATGERFGSKPEYNRWVHLQRLQAQGQISNLARGKETRMDIVINGFRIGHYTPDALYKDSLGYWVYEDVKGFATDDWRFRKKVVEAACLIEITEVPAKEWSDKAVNDRRTAAMQEVLPL